MSSKAVIIQASGEAKQIRGTVLLGARHNELASQVELTGTAHNQGMKLTKLVESYFFKSAIQFTITLIC